MTEFKLFQRYLPKLKCAIGIHKKTVVEDSEQKRHMMRQKGVPIPCSRGGYTIYQCDLCGHRWSTSWRAF